MGNKNWPSRKKVLEMLHSEWSLEIRIEKISVENAIGRVAAAPGRPMCIAIIDHKLVINLPGPSIACYYGMDWCVRFAVNKLLNQESSRRKTILARLSEDICYQQGMEILCKMEICKSDQGYETRQAPFRASTLVENLIAPGQFITNPEISKQQAGSMLEIELLRDESELKL